MDVALWIIFLSVLFALPWLIATMVLAVETARR